MHSRLRRVALRLGFAVQLAPVVVCVWPAAGAAGAPTAFRNGPFAGRTIGWSGPELPHSRPGASRGGAQVAKNKKAGDAFRDEIADRMKAEGRDVQKEVTKQTRFGRRVIDIEVSKDGKVLGGIATKVGGSRYKASQRAKDEWLKRTQGYPVNVVRDR